MEEIIQNMLQDIEQRKDAIVAAWIAQFGYKPGDCQLVQQQTDNGWKLWVEPKFYSQDRPKGGPAVTEKEFEAALSYLWQQAGCTPEASAAANDIRLFLFERPKLLEEENKRLRAELESIKTNLADRPW